LALLCAFALAGCSSVPDSCSLETIAVQLTPVGPVYLRAYLCTEESDE
jgi:hypothetical protein